jgi:hypothetical protein
LTEKRATIYTAADNLATRFLDEWAAGKYGDELPASQAPSAIYINLGLLARATGMPVWSLLLSCLAVLILVIILAAAFSGSPRRPASSPPPPDPRIR